MQHRFRLRIAHSRPGVDGRVRAQRPAPLFLPFRNSDPWDPAAKQWWLAAAPAHAAVLAGCGKTEQGSRSDSDPFTWGFGYVHGQNEFFRSLLGALAVEDPT